jgi:integrase
MPGKRAKILSIADVGDLLAFAGCTRHPLRNAVMVLLSAKAGLRAAEIANLTWDMVVDANGHISGLIELTDNAAKKCSGRSIPVHPDLIAALVTWRQVAPPSAYVIASERGGRMAAEHRRVVQPGVQEHRPERLLLAFRPPHVCHPRRAHCS